jgi:hypothetical protein
MVISCTSMAAATNNQDQGRAIRAPGGWWLVDTLALYITDNGEEVAAIFISMSISTSRAAARADQRSATRPLNQAIGS